MSKHTPTRHRAACIIATLSFAAFSLGASHAAEMVVNVSGLDQPRGEIGCALFAAASADRFPLDNGAATMQWRGADGPGATCRFTGVTAGEYAIAVSHDLNGNRVLDTNLFGVPVEQWGVSKHVRPVLRAPRFNEAAFRVSETESEVVVEVKVAK
jgi:uncharacterized protein (DUF2141 family)